MVVACLEGSSDRTDIGEELSGETLIHHRNFARGRRIAGVESAAGKDGNGKHAEEAASHVVHKYGWSFVLFVTLAFGDKRAVRNVARDERDPDQGCALDARKRVEFVFDLPQDRNGGRSRKARFR